MSAWKNRNTWRWRIMVGGHVAGGSARTREAALAAEAAARRELIAGSSGIQPKRTLAQAVMRYLESPEYLSLKSAVADWVHARNRGAKHSANQQRETSVTRETRRTEPAK